MKKISNELMVIKKEINDISFNLTKIIQDLNAVETNLRNIYKIYDIYDEVSLDD